MTSSLSAMKAMEISHWESNPTSSAARVSLRRTWGLIQDVTLGWHFLSLEREVKNSIALCFILGKGC